MDKIIALYKKGIDTSLNKENLKKTPLERIRQAQELLEFAMMIKSLNKKKLT
jgi:hypothetical protein